MGHLLREESRLHLSCNLKLPSNAAFGLQLLGNPPALFFNQPSGVIESHDGQNVPIRIFKAGEHSAPWRFFGWMAKRYTALTTLTILRANVFSEKDNLSGLADQLVLLVARPGSDQREDPGSIGRRDSRELRVSRSLRKYKSESWSLKGLALGPRNRRQLFADNC